ncbi:MAG: hypothetical protein ACWGQW_24270, partial [bacterium]
FVGLIWGFFLWVVPPSGGKLANGLPRGIFGVFYKGPGADWSDSPRNPTEVLQSGRLGEVLRQGTGKPMG